MSFALKVLPLCFPSSLKKRQIRQLFDVSAAAFQSQVPDLGGFSYDDLLARFAVFTKEEAEKAMRQGEDLQTIKNRLYESARQLGEAVRKKFRVRTSEEVMAASKILYSILGIDFEGNQAGEILIKRCFFSQFYSPDVCGVISSLDEGVAAGLSGGGSLVFYQRITQGRDSCRARLRFMEKQG